MFLHEIMNDGLGFNDDSRDTWHLQEIDYTKEAANAELFASNFKEMDYVKVPTVLWDYTTPQVCINGH